MDEITELKRLSNALAQPDGKLFFAPIRHHSPACAWALREMIREIKPKQILIEAPIDFENHIDLLLDEETQPPVAIASLIDKSKEQRIAAYYPFCDHSPEFIALLEGKKSGAKLSFIDLPSSDKVLSKETSNEAPVNLQGEHQFDAGDFVTSLSKRLGCRDGCELWDHMFEARLGTSDWKKFFADVGSYCSGLRLSTPPQQIEQEGDNKREQHMAAAIFEALKDDTPVLVVIGGFHYPALLNMVSQGDIKFPETAKTQNKSYLIRYGFGDLDALSGYASGLPQPGYYDLLWQKALQANGAPQWRETALDIVSDFTTQMRKEGHPITVPAQIEMLRSAECLAQMRNRPGALRHDLIDGTRLALVKGETGLTEVWTERLLEYLRGRKLGNIPASAGSPPLVENVRERTRKLRINVSDGERKQRKLDIRRKKPHLAASRLFHAMSMLETGFADKQVGPDFINNLQTDLLFEEWTYAWSPQVEARLIELSVLGDQLDTVCLGYLFRARKNMQEQGEARGLEQLTTLFIRGLMVGLGDRLSPFLKALEADIQAYGDFATTSAVLRRMHTVQKSAGPLGAPKELDIQSVLSIAFSRLIYLCEELPNTPEDQIPSNLEALRLTTELLRSPDSLYDHTLFDEAVDRVATANPPPEILGAVLAICVQGGRRSNEDISRVLSGSFTGAVLNQEERIGVLRGILQTVPALLWREDSILEIIDNFICNLKEEDFMNLLPHLRLAFTAFNPRETDRLAKMLGNIHGSAETVFTSTSSLSEEDLHDGLAIDKTLRQGIQADGLEEWLGIS